MINFIKKPISIISIIVILGLAAGGYFYFGREANPEFDVAIAKRSDLIQEVSVTGRVKPTRSVELAFEKSGKVSAVYADIGKQVSAGQILVVLENSELAAQLLQAEADVKIQEAKLNELRRGTRQEEIQVQEVKVENAKVALEDAKTNLIDKIRDAYSKSDDGVRNKVDQFFSNPRSSSPQINISGFNKEMEVEWQRVLIEFLLNSWQNSLIGLSASGDLDTRLKEAKSNLEEVRDFLNLVASSVNALTVNANLSQTTIDTYKSDVSTGRTNLNTAIVNLSAAEENYRSAKSSLTLAENELFLKKAGTIEEQIAAQEAQVEKAKANVENYRAQISKTILRAPISGMVTKQDAKVGEIVSANTPIVSLISASQFEIEANMPEADIAKVKLGNTAKVTLDAYGNDISFNVKVTAIDPAETIIDGVATYKTTFQFTDKDERVKSGMTANIDISTEKREGVIVIPQRAVITKNGDKIVRLLEGETPKEVKVKTGLRGSDGNIEIIEGINEGDRVIISFE